MSQAILFEKKKITSQKFTKHLNSYIKDHHIKPTDIKTMVVTECHLTTTPSIYYFSNLHELNLSQNKIETITNDLTQLTSLTSIDLSNNKLTEFSLLCDIPSLKSINVSRNAITIIPHEHLTKLSNIEDINVSHNELTEFDYEWIGSLKNLKTFSVTANRITLIKNENHPYSKNFGTPYAQVLPNLIIPHLYLGSVESSNKPTFKELHIEGVLSIGTKPDYISKKVEHKMIECGDSPSDDIAQYFPEAFAFIDKFVREGRNVLVHCVAGVSRSASLVISYVMKKENISFDEAINKVKEHRACVCPNSGFMNQLSKYKPSKVKEDQK